nr:uncharacterized protein LOC109426294 [Aedes albopictus]
MKMLERKQQINEMRKKEMLKENVTHRRVSHRKNCKKDESRQPVSKLIWNDHRGDEEGVNKKKSKSLESYDRFEPTKSPIQSPGTGQNLGSISTVSNPEYHHQHLQVPKHHHLLTIFQTLVDLNSADGDHTTTPVSSICIRRPQWTSSSRENHSGIQSRSKLTFANHVSAKITVTSGAMVPGATFGISTFGDEDHTE